MTKDKTRLDIEMVNRGLVDTRSKAQAVILLGAVYVNNQKVEKAGYAITPSDIVEFRDKRLPYVSRGGLKLEEAIKTWDIDCEGKLCCDIGASTGGFTDCLLQNGAATVHAIDVGHSQLAWKLRQDERVIVYEKLNARYIEPDDFPKFDIIVMDVSFISITKILPKVYDLLSDNGCAVTLIKPQFEVGRENVGDGVITDTKIQNDVINNIEAFVHDLGFTSKEVIPSPIKGTKGNTEFLIMLEKRR